MSEHEAKMTSKEIADLDAVLNGDEARLHPILSNVEVIAAQAEARAMLVAERKSSATKDLIERETVRLRIEEGLVTGDGAKDEMVSITLDLAEHAISGGAAGGITLSGRPYYHGFTYTVPRHIADTLREIMSRGHGHQNEIEGKGRAELFKRPYATDLSPIKGFTNAPAQIAA